MMNRRFLALALAGTLTLSLLTACGGGKDAPETQTTPPAVEETTPVPESSAPVEETPAVPESSAPAEESQEPESSPAAKPSAAPTTKPTEKPAEKPSKPSATPAPETGKPQGSVVESVWNDIAKLDIPSLTDLDGETLKALYGIDPADLNSFVCKMPMINVQATEFFIAEVKDGKMDAVKAGAEKRQADLEAQWSQYLPEQLELVQNYKLVVNGSYILFAVSTQAEEAVSVFNSYTK